MFSFSLPPDTRTAATDTQTSVIGLVECLPQPCRPLMDFNKLNQHTRLWRWIVYSRATTSAMALRWVLPEAFLVEDISGGC